MPDQEQDQQISLDEWERRTFERYGVPEGLRRSILSQESADGTRLKSPTNVKGRYQVTQATARQYGYDRDDQWQQPVAAAKHLRTLYDGVKKRNPAFSDKQSWLGASAEYYYGGDAFDKDGNLSAGSRDGYSTPAKYATSIAEKWSAFDRGESSGSAPAQGSPALKSLRPGATRHPAETQRSKWSKYGVDEVPEFETGGAIEQYDESGRKKIGARDVGITPAEGMRFDLSGGASKTPPKPASLPPRGRLKLARDGPRLTDRERAEGLLTLPRNMEEATQDMRRNVAIRQSQISPETTARLAKIEEFEAQPLTTQMGQQAKTYLASGGAELSRLTRRAVGAGLGAAQALQGGRFENVDARPDWLRKWEEERLRELAEEKQRYRPTLTNEIAQGIVEGAPVAAAAGLAGAATGGGALATMGTGGAIGALGADWDDPERAAAQTVLGAIAPYAGGKLGSAVAGRVAGRLASPAAQTATRALGEIGGGAAGNVLQSGAEQAAFEGDIDPRELAKQAVIGAGLSVPGALALSGRPARADVRVETEPAPEPRTTLPTPEAPRGEPELLPTPPKLTPEPAQTPKYDYSLTKVNLPKPVGDKIQALGRGIPDADLAEKGREDKPHVTVKYGLHGDDSEAVRKALADEGPIEVRLGKTSVFKNSDKDYDVVKVDVESPDLHRLNKKIADAAPHTDTFPTYEPHATVAYVKKGLGKKYAGDAALEGETITLDRIAFRDRSGQQIEIPLGGQAQPAGDAATIAGEPVSPRWLNAQRRQAAELLGLDPNQIPQVENQAPDAALQNLQTRPAGVEEPAATQSAAPPLKAGAMVATPEPADRPKPQFVAEAEQRLSDATSGKRAGSGAEQLFDQAIVTGWKSYKAGMGFIEWSREVIKQAGESVRPHLQRVWQDLTENFSVGPLPRTRADVERSPQFQRFFRDSKVVDEQGGPMVVYHGTPNSFDTFDPAKIKQGGSLGPGVYIAENPYTAMQYVSGYNVGENAGKSPNVMPLYLSMRQPLDVEAPLLDRAEVARLMPEDADYLPDGVKVSYFDVIDAVGDKSSQDVAKRLGYDGLVMNMPSGRVWLAFEPTQIKSATGNTGAFDPAKGSILGSGLGSLQPLFERPGRDKSSKTSQAAEPVSRRGRVAETIGAAQTAAQLGSPGFVIRNVLQHASHGAQELVTQGVAGLIDKAVSSVTGKRTIGGFGNPLEAAREVGRFIEDYKTGVSQAREAIKRGEPLPGSRLRDMPDPETLTAVGRRLSKVLTWINEVPDAGNWNAHFQRSMRDQARVQRRPGKASADESLSRVDQMIERAWAEADHASLRDKNFVSNSLGAIKKALNTASSPITGTDKFGLGDFVIKYTQVPGALVKRGIEYSPLGVIEGGYHAIKGDQRKAVQALARAVTGSASGSGVGAMLAAYGILVGPEHDAGQAAQLEREEGRRGYSLNLSALKRLAAGGWDDPDESGKLQAGDQLIGIDWLQPWALQASTGAAIYQAAKRGELKASGIAGAAADSLGQWLSVADDQTVLKNIRAAIPYKSKDDTLWDTTKKTLSPILTGAPASFVPSLARQVRQVVDPFARDTRPEQPKGLRAGLEEAKNKVKEGLPGLSQTLPTRPSLLTGEPKKTAIGGYSLPLRSLKMISPAPFTTYEPSPIAREAGRLQEAGHRVAFEMPQRQRSKKTGEIEPTGLLRRREEQFAKSFASAAGRLIEHPDYQVADDRVKAAAINNLAKYMRERTRKEVEDKTLEEIVERASSGIANREDK